MKLLSWRLKLMQFMLPIIVGGFCLGAAWPMPDEGMWTFDNPPLQQLKERYGFTPTPEWLEHLRLASVRFNDGGSGSFVSPTGLVLTNHHVARGQLQKMSSPNKDYVKEGFYARTPAEEIKCADLELNVLVEMENVSARVHSAAQKGMNDKQAFEARRAEMARIEKESAEATGLRSDMITLYHGGEYWLYRYKKYTDVRLVFAPEQQIAFFGGDPDNFTFPRHDLDMTIFRVYENGEPVESRHYFKWNSQGAAENELVFVAGHPGSTNRLHTVAQLEFLRDNSYPYRLETYQRRLGVLQRYAAQGKEQARQAQGQIFSVENAIKAWTGESRGLLDKDLFAKKQKEENEFRAQVMANAEWRKAYGGAWQSIAEVEKKALEMITPLRFRSLRGSNMASLASTIVKYVVEIEKPDAERLDGFHDAQLPSLHLKLFSPAPVYPPLEEVLLTDALQESLEKLGSNDPFIKVMLQGRTPAQAAKELVANTQMGDPAFRKSLIAGGEAAVAAANDALIVAARKLDSMQRELARWYQDNVSSVETAAGEKIGRALFAVHGKSKSPDATFTLRLSYGTVTGYPMNGTLAPAKTTIYGLYDRAYSFALKPPFDLPQRFLERKDRLNLATPANLVTTHDIIGGNSGSPVINKNGELVGLIFDGNIESLAGRFIYDDTQGRAVSVHTAYMMEALRQLYDAEELANELEGKKSGEVKSE